nr:sulf3a [Psylliodes laticollis]
MWCSKSAFLVFFYQILLVVSEHKKSEKKPNIIIILADDVGWNDFSLHGSNQIPTPNIDALGYNGVILDRFYTQQTCTPSRAALLTGKYPMRLGLQGTPINAGENRSMPFDTPTMAEHLKNLGYSTHLVGKWHLGAACKEHTPTKRGFDTHFGYWQGYVGYFSYEIDVTNPSNRSKNFTGFDLHDGFQPQWQLKGQYATELFAKKSLDIIEKHDTSTPLFLMLSHLAGHAGNEGIELGVPNKTRTEEVYSYINRSERRSYADLVNIMDHSVGEVVQKLSAKGMLENSIILFFSDNGAQTQGLFENFGSSWPFRGLKFTLFEGGVRGTAAIYSPLFEKKDYINKNLIHITDFLPTFYRAAGGNITDLGKIDGIDQWNVISKNETTKRSHILLNIDDGNEYSGILGDHGRYKLLNGSFANGLYNDYYGDSGRHSQTPPYNVSSILNSPTNLAIQKLKGHLDSKKILHLRKEITLHSCRTANHTHKFLCNGFCLFDIFSDPCETTNLIKDKNKQNIVKDLKEKLENYFTQIVPSTNKRVDVESDPSKFNNTWTPWLTCNKKNVYISGVDSFLHWLGYDFKNFINT